MTQAMELLHSQSVDEALAPLSGNPLHGIDDDRATKLSVFSAGEHQWTA
jgi:hypothetical protein